MKKLLIILLTSVISIGAFIIIFLALKPKDVVQEEPPAELEVYTAELSFELTQELLYTSTVKGQFTTNYKPNSYYVTLSESTVSLQADKFSILQRESFYEITFECDLDIEKISAGEQKIKLFAVFEGEKIAEIAETSYVIEKDLFKTTILYEGKNLTGLCTQDMITPDKTSFSFELVKKEGYIYPTVTFSIPFVFIPSKIELNVFGELREIKISDCAIETGEDFYLLKYNGAMIFGYIYAGDYEATLSVSWSEEETITERAYFSAQEDYSFTPGINPGGENANGALESEDIWSERI